MKRILATCSALTAVLVGSIPFIHMFTPAANAGEVAKAQCSTAESLVEETQLNPNRALFISCGGFL